jgi:hypothetical protein
MKTEKMKLNRPYWTAKIQRKGKSVIIDVTRIVRHSTMAIDLSRCSFAFPVNRKIFKE